MRFARLFARNDTSYGDGSLEQEGIKISFRFHFHYAERISGLRKRYDLGASAMPKRFKTQGVRQVENSVQPVASL